MHRPLSGAGGTVSVRRSLAAEPASVVKARRLVALVGELPARACRDAQLVVSELVTNALRHADVNRDDVIHVTVTRLRTRLRIDVADRHGAWAGSQRDLARGAPLGPRIVTGVTAHWHASGGVVTAWIVM